MFLFLFATNDTISEIESEKARNMKVFENTLIAYQLQTQEHVFFLFCMSSLILHAMTDAMLLAMWLHKSQETHTSV